MPPSLVQDPHTSWEASPQSPFQTRAPNGMWVLVGGATVRVLSPMVDIIPIQRLRSFKALHSLPRGSASSPWSCMVRLFPLSSFTASQLLIDVAYQTPRPANVHPAIPRHYLSTPNMNPVPIALMQGPTSVFIVTQANYDCSQPFPIIALSQPCTYQEYSLSSAMAKDFDGLFRPDEPAFRNVTFNQKVSIRLRVCYLSMNARRE